MKISVRRITLLVCYLVALCAIAWFTYSGWDYYRSPLIERPRHPLYWSLKPGGTLGLRFGIAGAGMMTLMLVYSLRKRVRLFRRIGKVRGWLDFHILLGIIGPLFIVLHSSFKVGGLVALAFWSMVAVAVSGVAGRFLYAQIPRSRAGDELSLAQVHKLDAELTRELVEDFGLPASEATLLEGLAEQDLERQRSVWTLLLRLPIDAWLLRRRLRRFRRRFPALDRSLLRRLGQTVRRKALLRRRIRLWDSLHRVFHYWHVAHKPFAIVMYLFMFVHIAVAWWTGYAWQY
jgi:hypothetical protein